MQKNASAGAKVLPIARISIRNTGMLRTTAEASGKSSAGLQPPMRLRSHESEGAYASENKSAVMINEVTVLLPRSAASSLWPSRIEKAIRIASNPSNQEQREIETSFMLGVR